MDPEVLAAIVNGMIGVLGAILGVLAGGLITYKIEGRRIAAERGDAPTHLLLEKRMTTCEELAISANNASGTIFTIWELTDASEMTPDEVNARIKEAVTKETASEQLARAIALYGIYGTGRLLEKLNELARTYQTLLSAPTHLNATLGIDCLFAVENELRKELQVDALSGELLSRVRDLKKTRRKIAARK